MKYIKRLWFSTFGLLFLLACITVALLGEIWFHDDVDRESWKFWESLG